jgi:ABC-type Fe3+/spermidine/putrescine transport system ATPase subunit
LSASALRIEDLCVGRNGFRLGPLSLELPVGSCLVLQGANGAGKTTLLEALAGFAALESGRITLHGEDITALPPERRRIAYVPQDLALFPHMSVERNVAFGLRGRDAEHHGRLERLLHDFQLADLRTRRPDALSRGQRQRLALARALATEPALVLLDEPSVNLDAASRRGLHAGVRRLLEEHGLAVLYVTHDQSETTSLADHVAIINQGRLLQAGPLPAVLRGPADARVAAQLGIDNLWPARVLGPSPQGLRLDVNGCTLDSDCPATPEGELLAGIGAGEVELYREPPPGDAFNCLQVRVVALETAPQGVLLQLDGPLRVSAWAPGWWAAQLGPDTRLWARLPPQALRLIRA